MSAMFDGRVVLVTGGSSGIGRAVAIAFAAEGARVVVAGRRGEDRVDTIAQIRAAGGEATYVQADVSKSFEVESMVAVAIERYGGLDFAVNNAGIEGDAYVPVAAYCEATWDDVINVNLKGVFLCMKHQIPHIVASKGAIVNVSSVAGLSGGRAGAAYYASKHGVVGLTRAVAMEYAGLGVRVNAVAPAVIDTPMAERAYYHDSALLARVSGLHPLGRIGNSHEVASAALWLCSPGASFITGHVLPVDGGFLVP
jgi:NAD(P)-dependent dehydrogenase (short-subunit alcohol dehydrogenase family)